MEKSEQQNVTPLLAGVPAYMGAVLAAGVAVASGGTLAGAAVAALFRGEVERSYEEQIAKGGILLLVHPRTPEDVTNAKEILNRHATRAVETEPDRDLT